MPCNPQNLTINIPAGPTGPSIPKFGIPFAPTPPSFTLPYPSGFPEDLLNILDKLQLILPPGVIKPGLNPNFGKDVFDGIMKLLDQFFPFLMLYKFFLPILNLIICIIEILCALLNPFKLIGAINRLFRVCLPQFLALFPVFALVVMVLSILLLIISLVEYLVGEVEKLVVILLRNVKTIEVALAKADEQTVLAAVNKIGMVLCAFQNLFVLLSLFDIIISVIKDILKSLFNIPPCDDGDNGNINKCCTPDVCPSFIKNNDGLTLNSGSLQYYNTVEQDGSYLFGGQSLPFSFTNAVRQESWQFYDIYASIPDAFWNITNAYDLPAGITQIFFPTDANYTASTPISQVPYTVDLRLFYNPANFARSDSKGPRYVKVLNCVILKAPTQNLTKYDNSTQHITNGVLLIQGGLATEDDGITQIILGGTQATLNTLIHTNPTVFYQGTKPVFNPTDGYEFNSVTYTFHINYPVLLQKALITLGCLPSVSLNRTFINNVYGGNAGVNFTLLNNLINGTNGNVFPDVAAAQECLSTALAALQSNVNEQSVANFQATTTVCLNKLSSDAASATNSIIGIGFDPYHSTFTINPSVQFTTQSIIVSVSLNETNGQSLTTNLSASVATSIGKRITANNSFGKISDFIYDGYQYFTADITSQDAGSGTIEISFDDKVISIVNIPTDLTQSPSISPIIKDYSFIFSPTPKHGFDGELRRDQGDIARDGTKE